jgi:hypothetical protein
MVLGTEFEIKDKEVQTIWDTMTREKFADLSFNTLQRYIYIYVMYIYIDIRMYRLYIHICHMGYDDQRKICGSFF